MEKKINRIKAVIVDKEITNKWLAEHLGKDQVNSIQMVHERKSAPQWELL